MHSSSATHLQAGKCVRSALASRQRQCRHQTASLNVWAHRTKIVACIQAKQEQTAGHQQQQGRPSADDNASATCASLSRRVALVGACLASFLTSGSPAWAEPELALDSLPLASSSGAPDTTITHKVYLDIGIAPTALKTAAERTVGDKSSIPIEDAASTGRIVLGLYGNHVPITVANFLALIRSGALDGTVFSRVLPGEYIQAGQQGQRKMGQVEAPPEIQTNTEVSSAKAFALQHNRAGVLSLSLSDNDDDPRVKSRPGYKSLEFLITTGPGPVPRLDGLNIPFGKVVEGLDVVNTITQVPTFQPNERTSALNLLAGQLGDGRAAGVRRKYGRPFKAVVVLKAGELPVDS